jgi:AcrR family transcriptional regulator
VGYHHGDLRTALIAAGFGLIAEKGFGALSVAEAARRAGVSAAAPYRHFTNRDAFLIAIATEAGVVMGDQLEAALVAAAERSEDPLDQLEAIAETYVAFMTNHRVGFDLIFASELREVEDEALRTAGRRVIDLMMPAAVAVSPDLMRALELTEEIWTTAHGYAALFLAGFFGDDCARVIAAARRTARRLGQAAQSVR